MTSTDTNPTDRVSLKVRLGTGTLVYDIFTIFFSCTNFATRQLWKLDVESWIILEIGFRKLQSDKIYIFR
jgi:hypothetical protein